MRRIWICASLVMFLLVAMLPHTAVASTFSLTVYIDGEELDTSVEPQMMDARTFVPIRVIAEKWGAVVGWHQEREQVRIAKDDQKIDLYIHEQEAYVNGEVVVSDAAPIVIKGTTLIPLRFVSELLGAKVDYDAKSRSVMVNLPEQDPDEMDEPTEEEPDVGESSEDDSVEQELETEDEADEDSEIERPTDKPTIHDLRIEDDQLVLQANEALDPTVFYLKNPDRIVMDITGVELALDHITTEYDEVTHQSKFVVSNDSSLIESVRFAKHDPASSQVRFVLDLASRGDYELTRDEEKNTIMLDVEHGSYHIVIDAGHGDHDPGATGYSGKREKDFNLSLARKVQELLEDEPHITALMTRTTDEFLELGERTDFANDHEADAFLSIHANAFMRSTRGTETYYTHDYQYEFAKVMHEHLLEATGFPDRKLQHNRFYVTRNTDMPAALIEVGFLTNPEEESILFQDDFQDKVAKSLVNGMKEYFEL